MWFEQLIRGFLWNHEAKKKWHYIGWSTFTADKHKGGAGIISVVDWYEALKRRQATRATQIPCGWWAEAVKEKYRFTSWIQASKSSGLSLFWKAISTVGPSLIPEIRTEIADGQDTSVLDDCWLPGIVLDRSGIERTFFLL